MGAVDLTDRDPGADAPVTSMLARFSGAHRAAVRAEWSAAAAAGLEMRIEDDGQILLGAAPSIDSTMFNRGLGFTEAPERSHEAVMFFGQHGVAGEVVLEAGDAPAAVEPRLRLDVHVGARADVTPPSVEGLTIREIDPEEAETWMSVVIVANAPAPDVAAVWRSMTPHIARTPGWILSVGELDNRIVAAGSLFVAERVGWLSWASVLPGERGRGIQRGMIAARSRVAHA